MRVLNTAGTGRRAIALVVIIAACLGLCQGSQPTTRSSSLYAFTTDHELTVMRDGEVLARTPISGDRSQDGVTWTLNDRYAADITDSSASTADEPVLRELVAIDTYTGAVERYPCPACTSLAPVGGNMLLAAESANLDVGASIETEFISNMLRFDLTGVEPAVQFGSRLPSNDFGYLLGGYYGGAVLLGVNGSEEQYFTVSPDGGVEHIADYAALSQEPSSDKYLRAVVAEAAGQTSTGPVVAIGGVLARPQPACGEASYVTIYSASSHESITTDTSAFTPPGRSAGINSIVTVEDLWWATDGYLHAIVSTSDCGAGAPKPTSTEWKFTFGRWEPVFEASAQYARQLPDGTELLLDPQGGLTWQSAKHRSVIATGVRSLATVAPVGNIDAYQGSPETSCLLGDQFDLGTRSGDLDGDSTPDLVDLVLCRANPPSSSGFRLVAHVSFGNGRHLDQTLTDDAQDTSGWLGITDLTGSRHDDMLLTTGTDVSNIQHISVFAYLKGRLALLPGDLTPPALVTSESTSEVDGFRCVLSHGHAQVVTFDFLDDYMTNSYIGGSTTYQATNGTITKVGSTSLSYAAPGGIPNTVRGMPEQVTGQAGAHCPGLTAFPGDS